MATTTKFNKARGVGELTFTLTYSDSTAAEMFKLPANVRIIDWIVNVTTAFSGGTTSLYVGTSATSTEIINALAVSSKGRAALTTELALPCYEPTAMTSVYAKVGASNTAGAVKVTCLISLVEETFLGG